MDTTVIESKPAETLIIAKCDEGFRVCSPLTPGKQFVVSGLPESPHCTCPDFVRLGGDGTWQCGHIQAVLREAGLAGVAQTSLTPAPVKSRGASESKPTGRKAQGGRNGNDATMLLKRSVSPDGRIDSLSVEFSCSVGNVTAQELKQRAEKILALQAEIASGFLNAHGNGNGKAGDNGIIVNAAPGQLLAVASMTGKWGRRFFINVLVNGQVLKLFGSEKQLAEAVTAAGFASVADHIAEGMALNLPCRVVTKPSPDGKYINVERVLPAQAGTPVQG